MNDRGQTTGYAVDHADIERGARFFKRRWLTFESIPISSRHCQACAESMGFQCSK